MSDNHYPAVSFFGDWATPKGFRRDFHFPFSSWRYWTSVLSSRMIGTYCPL
jgi:hypothetical protein